MLKADISILTGQPVQDKVQAFNEWRVFTPLDWQRKFTKVYDLDIVWTKAQINKKLVERPDFDHLNPATKT